MARCVCILRDGPSVSTSIHAQPKITETSTVVEIFPPSVANATDSRMSRHKGQDKGDVRAVWNF